MRELSGPLIHLAKATLFKREAQGQGGLLNGQDPTAFNTQDPLRLWIIQIGVIVLTSQLLSLGLRKIRQPRVIAEVITGILLGPTAFGRIPGFQQHIFPSESIPYLSLVANIGLCLFLFLVGLEIDAAVIKRNARLSATVALAGMSLPFGLGAALSVPLYHTFIDQSVKFTNFMLFTGVAYSITAFPVLCRILTELKLLDTTVGIVVLSAGIGNDIVGWTLLALSVALVNGGAGIMALYILLTCFGWTLLLLFPVRYVLRYLAHRTGSIKNGPTMFFMTVTIIILFGSAFMTDIIGVHAIFGAFLAGVIVPREGGLAIALTEKLEDMVSIIFLPLYFTLSGLSTNLGLLDNGITWAYTVAICALSYSGKFGGCTVAARFSGFSWREASTIGSLMSCKGLVELIVLNVGLNAGILSQRVFSMFVLEALLLTFMTTPAVVLLYPPKMRVRVSPTGASFNNISGGDRERAKPISESRSRDSSRRKPLEPWKTRFTVVLDKPEHLPGMMALAQFMQPPPQVLAKENTDTSSDVCIEALRLIELSDRTSAVMKSSAWDSLIYTDPMLCIFRAFGELNGMAVSTSLAIVSYDDLASSVAEVTGRNGAQLVLLPWLPPHHDTNETASPTPSAPGTPRVQAASPFESMFRTAPNPGHSASTLHSHFVRSVFAQSVADVALYVDQSIPGEMPKVTTGASGTGDRWHLFLPFFGGPDDRLALEFVVQLCAHPRVSATVVRFSRVDLPELQQSSTIKTSGMSQGEAYAQQNSLTIQSTSGIPDTVYGHATTQTRLQSETADNIVWQRYAAPSGTESLDSVVIAALARIEWHEVETHSPLRAVVDRAAALEDGTSKRRSRLLAVAGRSRRLAAENHHVELKGLMDEHGGIATEVKKTVGDVAAAFIVTGSKTSIVVLQAADAGVD